MEPIALIVEKSSIEECRDASGRCDSGKLFKKYAETTLVRFGSFQQVAQRLDHATHLCSRISVHGSRVFWSVTTVRARTLVAAA